MPSHVPPPPPPHVDSFSKLHIEPQQRHDEKNTEMDALATKNAEHAHDPLEIVNLINARTIRIASLSRSNSIGSEAELAQSSTIVITPSGNGTQSNDNEAVIPAHLANEISEGINGAESEPQDTTNHEPESRQHPDIDLPSDHLVRQSVQSVAFSEAFSGEDSDEEFVDCVDEIEALETPMHREDAKKVFDGGHLEWRHEMGDSPTDEQQSKNAEVHIISNGSTNGDVTGAVTLANGLSISLADLPEEDILKGFVVKNLDDGSQSTLFEHAQTPHPFYTQLAIKEREREQNAGAQGVQTGTSSSTSEPPTQTHPEDKSQHIKDKISRKFTKFLSTMKHSHHLQAAMGKVPAADDDTEISPSNHKLKAPNHMRVQCKRKRSKQFPDLRAVESTFAHDGAIWCMEFSHSGDYLATGGQDGNICLWKINKNKYADPNAEKGVDLREKEGDSIVRTTTTDNGESTTTTTTVTTEEVIALAEDKITAEEDSAQDVDTTHPTWLSKKPVRVFKCRQRSDVVALSWSKRNFLISSSMDHRVSVWHVSRDECLVSFKHNELVTSLAFHPEDDSLFVTGSFDEKLRLFNLRNRELVTFQDTKSMITALGFADNGKTLVVGTFDGKCIFYSVNKTEIIRRTRIDVRSRRGKNKGKKVTAVVASPDQKRILVSSNDSRIRLYSLIDYSEISKFKGLVNTSSQIKASFNADGSFIVSGSENNSVYLWSTNKELAVEKKKPLRKKTLSVDSCETFRDSDSTVTNAIFAPFRFAYPGDLNDSTGLILATSNFKGKLSIYESLAPPESG